MSERTPPHVFQFSIRTMAAAIALFAVALTVWNCRIFLDDPMLGPAGERAVIIVGSSLLGGCAFGAIGMFFRCGQKAAVFGALVGAIAST